MTARGAAVPSSDAKYSFDFCAIATPSGFSSAVRCVIVMRRRHRRVARQLAMIEPHRVDAAAGLDGDRFPAAIAGGIGARHDRGRRERPSAVVRARLEQLGPVRALRRPDDHDRGSLSGAESSATCGGCSPFNRASPCDVVDADRRRRRRDRRRG